MSHTKKCKSTTTKGVTCKRNASKGDFCAQHLPKTKSSPKKKTTKSSPKKQSSKSDSTKVKYESIYTLTIWETEVAMSNNISTMLFATSKKLLQKEIEKHLKPIKKHLRESLTDKEIKKLPIEFTSFKSGHGDVYESIERIHGVLFNKRKLRIK